MVKLTRKYKKNNKTKSMKKHVGGMKSSSKKSRSNVFTPISGSFKPPTQSGILPRPHTPDVDILFPNLLEIGKSPLFKKNSSNSSEYKDALSGSDIEEINKLFNKINYEEAKTELGEKYKKNFPYKNEKELIENMLSKKEEIRKKKSKIRSSLRGNKKVKSKSDNKNDDVLALIFKNPEILKIVSNKFEIFDAQQKHPTLYSITRSKKFGGTRKNKSRNRV